MASKLLNLINQVNYASWYGLFRRDFLIPTFAIENFNELEVPANIKIVLLDKDNCFAKPHTTSVWPAFAQSWQNLLAKNHKQYEVFVVSNTAGDAAADPAGKLAKALENEIGVSVLRHQTKKPMCYTELISKFNCKPEEVLVVGDRLLTDVLMANLIGAQSVWIKPGVHPGILNHLEISLYNNNKNT